MPKTSRNLYSRSIKGKPQNYMYIVSTEVIAFHVQLCTTYLNKFQLFIIVYFYIYINYSVQGTHTCTCIFILHGVALKVKCEYH